MFLVCMKCVNCSILFLILVYIKLQYVYVGVILLGEGCSGLFGAWAGGGV